MNTKKKMTVHRLLSGVLVLLGFSACSDNNEGNLMCEYGSPSVSYQVKGKVTTATGVPIEGIQVIVRDPYAGFLKELEPYSYSQGADTVFTNDKGEFTGHKAESSSIYDQKVFFHDIDGDANGGTFESDSVEMKKMDIKQVQEGGSWYSGGFEITTTVKLDREAKPEGQPENKK